MLPPSRGSSIRPWIGAGCLYALLAVLLTYPLTFVAATHATTPIDDPLFTAWLLWWNTHAMPLSGAWWNAPIFFPTAGAMAFSELLLGLLPITAPIQWLTHNPALALNVAVLLSFPLCALAAHALAFEVTRRHDAALLAGLAFGFSPFRANEFGHVQMLSYYWAPVALLALHRYLRSHHRRWLVLCGCAFLMQVLCNGYALFQLPIVIGLWLIWFPTTWKERAAVVTTVACAAAPLVPILLRYQAIQQSFHLARSIAEIRMFSADISSLFSAHPEAYLLGHALTFRQGYALFPGVTVALVLAAAAVMSARKRPSMRTPRALDRMLLGALVILGVAIAVSVIVFGPWKLAGLSVSHAHKPLSIAAFAAVLYVARGPRWRAVWRSRSALGFYALAAGTCYVLALGPEPRLLGAQVLYKAPYAWLMALPGFDAVRAPDRFAMLATLCLSLTAALIYARWMTAAHRPRWLFGALVAGLIVDGATRVHVSPLPPPGPAASWAGVSAVVELPLAIDTDVPAMYRSVWYGRPLVNGASGYTAPHYAGLTTALQHGDVEVLREFARQAPLGIAIDRSARDDSMLETAMARMAGVTLLDRTPGWSMFVLTTSPSPAPEAMGPVLAVLRVRANQHPDEVAQMRDDRISTAWNSGAQLGGEEVVIEMEGTPLIRSVELAIGSCPFGFPRTLVIETSNDEVTWTEVGRQDGATVAVRAAIAHPGSVPLRFDITPTQAHFVRLRQIDIADHVPWCVGELRVH